MAHMDLLSLDIYRTRKCDLIPILNSYGIKCSDANDTQETLRPIAASLKRLVTASITNEALRTLLHKVLNEQLELDDTQERRFPELSDLQKTVETRNKLYDTPANSDTEEEKYQNSVAHKTPVLNSDNKHVYETINLQNNGPAVIPVTMPPTPNVPLIPAGSFSGLPSEDPNAFLEHYEVASESNNWDNDIKLKLFAAHLSNIALSWYKHYKEKHAERPLAWDTLKRDFILAFQPQAQASNLQQILEKKIQGEHESGLNYFLNVLTTCKRYDQNLPEKQIINYIISGLKPEVCQHVLTLQNDTLLQLEQNLKTAEVIVQAQSRNREKYYRESTKHNTQLNAILSAKTDYTPHHSAVQNSDQIAQLQEQVNVLTNLVATLTTEAKNPVNRFSRSRSPKHHYQYSRSPSLELPSYPHKSRHHYHASPSFETQPNFQAPTYHPRHAPRRVNFQANRSSGNFHRDANPNPPRKYCEYCRRFTNHNSSECWHKPQQPANQSYFNPPQSQTEGQLFCKYCKSNTHTIANCVKSKYYQGPKTDPSPPKNE